MHIENKIALTQNDTNKIQDWRLGVFNLWEMRCMAMCREAIFCRVFFRTYLGHSVRVGSQAGAAKARRATSQTRNHKGPRVRE